MQLTFELQCNRPISEVRPPASQDPLERMCSEDQVSQTVDQLPRYTIATAVNWEKDTLATLRS